MMEIRVLRYFLAVAAEQSITKASELLHITQPTLSRQLMQLEEELGVSLFTRGKTRIALTEEGVLFRRRAQEIVSLSDKAQKEMSCHGGVISGQVLIGCGELRAVNFLAGVIKQFQESYPNVQFDFYSGNVDSIQEMIDKGLLDIGLVSEPADISKYDYCNAPCREHWGLYLRSDSPLAQKAYLAAGDLVGLPLIISKRGLVQRQFEQWFGDCFNKLNIVATYDLAYNSGILVENGVGCALGLEGLIPECAAHSVCFRPLLPVIETGTVFIWKKHQVFSLAAAKLMFRIKEAARLAAQQEGTA